MRSVTHQDPAALLLLKTLLEAVASPGEEGVDSKGKAPPEGHDSAQPRLAPPPPKTPPGSPPGFNKPASVPADAVAAQMLATLMAEDDVASKALAELGTEREVRRDAKESEARPEEPALAQPKPGTPNGPIPWPTEALAAYSARPRELLGLKPGGRPSGIGHGGGSDSVDAKANTLKLVRRALLYACATAVVVVLLNRQALLG